MQKSIQGFNGSNVSNCQSTSVAYNVYYCYCKEVTEIFTEKYHILLTIYLQNFMYHKHVIYQKWYIF